MDKSNQNRDRERNTCLKTECFYCSSSYAVRKIGKTYKVDFPNVSIWDDY